MTATTPDAAIAAAAIVIHDSDDGCDNPAEKCGRWQAGIDPENQWHSLHVGHVNYYRAAARAILEAASPAMAAAAREELSQQIRELHSEFRIYDECDHDHTDEDVNHDRAVDCGDFVSCHEAFMYSVCAHCCTEPEYGQTETCASDHDHKPSAPLCPTLALLAKEAPGA